LPIEECRRLGNKASMYSKIAEACQQRLKTDVMKERSAALA
jgi:hypothetical protein